MLDIPMTEVDSSNVHSVGYDAETRTLRIIFKTNQDTHYDYKEVPESRYEGMLNADSVGRYFIQHIKGNFEFTKGQS